MTRLQAMRLSKRSSGDQGHSREMLAVANLAEWEVKELEDIFDIHDADKNGILDPEELHLALLEIGLNGSTPEERKEIQQICSEMVRESARGGLNVGEFALKLIPQVRVRLQDIR